MFGTYRTFLALMVVAFHLGGIPNIGPYAVFGFYILSGYLMTLVIQTNYGYTIPGVYKYALNRFLRIYPIYWVSIIFSAALIWYFGSGFTSGYHGALYLPQDASELFNNLLIFFPVRENPRLTPPAWALTVEIFFYILIGLGISRNKVITSFWFSCSLIYHVLVWIFQLGWEYKYFTIYAASLPFATGALIFHHKYKLNKIINSANCELCSYIPYLFASALLVNWGLGYFSSQSDIFFYSNYILCALMVVALSDKTALPYLNKNFDRWMGDFSYPIYLIHLQIGLVVVVIFGALGITVKRPELVIMFASVPLIFLCSWLITITIEKPIEKLRAKVKSGLTHDK